MSVPLLIWIWLSLKSLVVTGVILGVILFSIALIWYACERDYARTAENVVKANTMGIKRLKIIGYPTIALMFLGCLVPNSKDLQWIIGGSVAYSIATTDEAKKLPDNLLKSMNIFLENTFEQKDNE